MKREIIILVDASGSMHTIKNDTEGGINALLEEQAKVSPDALVTIVEFGTEELYKMRYHCTCKATPITQVKPYRLSPSGGTPLLDALGTLITETSSRLAELPEDQRPDQVDLVIATDGEENSSVEHTLGIVKELLSKRQRECKKDKPRKAQIHTRGWNVIYLGANQDAIKVAGQMGISPRSSMAYHPDSVEHTYAAASAAMSRSVAVAGVPEFTDEERKRALGG